MRSVFSSESVKVVQFDEGALPGGPAGGISGCGGGAEGWRAVTRVLRSYAHAFRNDSVTTIFPGDCSVCSGPMTAWSKAPVCSTCVDRVGPAREAVDGLCSVCGEALGMESARFAAALGMSVCTMCRLAPPPFARAIAYATYEDELRDMLHLLKYQGVTQLASGQLGDWLAESILMLAGTAGSRLTVVAVPLFPTRERKRGFNQSVLLADAAIARLKKLRPLLALRAEHGALQRVRDTEAQFALNARGRRRNLRGAFRVVDVEAVRGREVLLIDDIMTTGATARECALVLMGAGSAKVWVATLARAQAESFVGSYTPESAQIAMWDPVIEPGPRAGFVQGAKGS